MPRLPLLRLIRLWHHFVGCGVCGASPLFCTSPRPVVLEMSDLDPISLFVCLQELQVLVGVDVDACGTLMCVSPSSCAPSITPLLRFLLFRSPMLSLACRTRELSMQLLAR